MATKNSNELSNEELIKLKKMLNLLLLISIVLVPVSYLGISLANNNFYKYVNFLIPTPLLPPIYFISKRLNGIKSEIKTRNLNL